MPATPISNPVNVGPYLMPFNNYFEEDTEKDIQWLRVSFGERLQISEDDIRNSSRYLIRTNRGLFPLDLSEAKQAVSPASSLKQVILRFFTGSGGRTLLRCSYHYPERTQELTLERFTGQFSSLKPYSCQCLHIELTESRSWMKTGLLTVGGIALALLAAAAWMKKKGMTGNRAG